MYCTIRVRTTDKFIKYKAIIKTCCGWRLQNPSPKNTMGGILALHRKTRKFANACDAFCDRITERCDELFRKREKNPQKFKVILSMSSKNISLYSLK